METVPDALRRFFSEHPRAAIAFSGGTDSSYLLYAAKACGAECRAYTVHGQFQTEKELETAKRVSAKIGIATEIIEIDVLSDPLIASNPEDRCYHCKNRIFGSIIKKAEEDGFACILDATNATDDPNGRPGMKALEELGILSPLRICGITKPQVRELSRRAELETWKTPSNSCLATRIPHGMRITEELLKRTEACESELHDLGLMEIRVRTRPDGAVLETVERERSILDSNRAEVERILLKYYASVSYSARKPGL